MCVCVCASYVMCVQVCMDMHATLRRSCAQQVLALGVGQAYEVALRLPSAIRLQDKGSRSQDTSSARTTCFGGSVSVFVPALSAPCADAHTRSLTFAEAQTKILGVSCHSGSRVGASYAYYNQSALLMVIVRVSYP